MRIKRIIAISLTGLILTGCNPFAAENTIGGTTMKYLNNDISEFNLSQLTVNDGYCENALEKEIDYLLSFDIDRLVYNFRKNAGLDTKGAEPYGGWENTLIGGHSVGHYIVALSQAYANNNVSESDRVKIKKMLDTVISELSVCQREDGFLWGGQLQNLKIDFQFDNVEEGKCDLWTQAWVPWYTMHKIFTGLNSAYLLAGNEQALEIEKKLGDWVYERTQSWDENTHNTVLSIEYGGMNDCLYDLYNITGDDRYAIAAHAFDEDALFERIRTDGHNVLNNRHANTTIPKIMGALKRYEVCHGRRVDGKAVDASEYLETAEIFWQMVIDHHTYVTGANSEWEHFGEDDVLNKERTNANCETCNVYNMLKLSKDLFKVTGDKKYADYMENAFINDILASQNPETGMTTYFQAMATGYFRVYSSEFNHFWCCTGSGMENMTKLGEMIYFCTDTDLYVNMYLASEIEWAEKGIKLSQETNLPISDKTSFKIKADAPTVFSLKLRIPDWAKGDITVLINGEEFKYDTLNGYAVIDREWKNGDKVNVTVPLGFTSYNMVDGLNTVAFKYGPVLLCAELGKENMLIGSTGIWVKIPDNTILNYKDGKVDDTLVLKTGIDRKTVRTSPDEYFERIGEDELKFKFTASDNELTFIPYYLAYDVRYGIYWSLKNAE